MSSFLNNAVNYSEIELVKTKFLKPVLKACNEYVFKKEFKEETWACINNDNKYYLFVLDKACINNKKTNLFKILYFFKIDGSDEFFMEIDCANTTLFKKDFELYEGYLYNKNHFMITDILINQPYKIRKCYLESMFDNKTINNDWNIKISLHHILEDEKAFYKLFTDNFIYKNELKAVEKIYNNSLIKTQTLKENICEYSNEDKFIHKTKYIDVYKVYNIDTNNEEGILYVKSLGDSKYLLDLFKEKEMLRLESSFNKQFNKWQIKK